MSGYRANWGSVLALASTAGAWLFLYRTYAGFQLEVKAEGRPLASGEAMPRAEFRTVGPAFFRAAGVPIVKGREFAETDRKGSGMVVILNKTLADQLFPDRDPIGQPCQVHRLA